MKDTGEIVIDYGTYAYSIAPIPTSVKNADKKPSATTAVPYASCNAKNTKVTGDVSEDRTGDISKACGNFFTVKDVKPGDKALHSSAESPKFDFYVQWVDGCKLPGGSQSQNPNSPLEGKCESIFANVFDVCKSIPVSVEFQSWAMSVLIACLGSANGKGNNGAGGTIQVGCLEYKATLSYTPPSPGTSSSAPPKSTPTEHSECRVGTDDCVYSHPCYGGSTGPWCNKGYVSAILPNDN